MNSEDKNKIDEIRTRACADLDKSKTDEEGKPRYIVGVASLEDAAEKMWKRYRIKI